MLLNKNEIIKRLNRTPPMVSNIKDRQLQLQPAGLDLSVKKIYGFESPGCLDFDNSKRELSSRYEIHIAEHGVYYLRPGCYQVEVNERFNMPLDVVGFTISRSTLQRCGAAILTGFFDPGYIGGGVSLLEVYNSKGLKLCTDARICQMAFEYTKETEAYNGIYARPKP